MKIAFSTSSDSPEEQMESRFGRTPKFIIHDLEAGSSKVIDNKMNMNAPQGAGIQSAMNLIMEGVGAVVTGHCGPKAFNLLKNAGISVYLAEGVSVSEALRLYKANALKLQESADVEGHWK